MAYGSNICDLCTEILIYDSYWKITSKDFFKTVRLTEGFFSDDHKNCPLSVLWRCPFYREFHYSKSSTKTIGACEKCSFYGGVRLTEMSVSRELTVYACLSSLSPFPNSGGSYLIDNAWIVLQISL